MNNPKFLSASELAILLHIPTKTIYRLAKCGAIPSARLGGRLVFEENTVLAYIEGQMAASTTPSSIAQTSPPQVVDVDAIVERALAGTGAGVRKA